MANDPGSCNDSRVPHSTASRWSGDRGGAITWGALLAAVATWLLAAVPLVLWLVVSSRDHYFRDELYFVIAGRHPDLGYVDFPMMTAWLASVSDEIFGDSLGGLRVFPALAGSATVALTALMAREMGGGPLARFLAALATLVAPVFLATNALFGPDALDRTFWVAGCFVLARMLRHDDPRLWLVFGAIAALGLLTKMTMLVFGFAVVVGLLAGGRWRLLLNPWALGGGAIAFAGLAPYLLWQLKHDWPTLTFWANYGGKLADLSWGEFALQQILGMNPVALPLWVAGLYFLLFGWSGRSFRPLGLAFLAVLALCLITRAKSYFLAPAYPALLAAGGVLLADTRAAVRWLVIGPYAVLLAVSGVPMAIAAAPILPPDTTARILAIMGPERLRQEKNATAELPQYLADRYGWEEMVATVASVYHGLSPEEQREACILVGNYGRAAAIDFYGPRHGLPPAISGHNNYFLWGPRDCTGRVVITTGQSDRALRPIFRRIDRMATVTCAYCMPSENHLPVWVARGATRPMATIWPSLKHLD